MKYWVDCIVADWPFKRIIPAHFVALVFACASDFKDAFSFLNNILGENLKDVQMMLCSCNQSLCG